MKRLISVAYSENLEPEVKSMVTGTLKDFHSATGAALAQTTALGVIREMIPEDAVIVGAAGSLPGDLQRMWTTDALYSYNMEYGYSTMGYEIAGAWGSKLANPEKEVYAMSGDGSFLMLHSELVTAIQESKKITVLLFDNGGFGCINNLQMGKGIDSLATEFRYGAKGRTAFLPIDYTKCAEGYGAVAFSARTEEELRAALAAALKETQCVLIDIKVLPKTMTEGCEGGWWQTGATRVPRNKKQSEALRDLIENTKN